MNYNQVPADVISELNDRDYPDLIFEEFEHVYICLLVAGLSPDDIDHHFIAERLNSRDTDRPLDVAKSAIMDIMLEEYQSKAIYEAARKKKEYCVLPLKDFYYNGSDSDMEDVSEDEEEEITYTEWNGIDV